MPLKMKSSVKGKKPKKKESFEAYLEEHLESASKAYEVSQTIGEVSVESPIVSKGTTHVLHQGTMNKPGSAQLRVEGGRTINLGNYESARIGITVSVSCEQTVEGLEGAYDFATSWVSEKMEQAVKEVKGS
jgi:hypothetical protein